MIWTKPATYIILTLIYFGLSQSYGYLTMTHLLFSVFILFLFFKLITMNEINKPKTNRMVWTKPSTIFGLGFVYFVMASDQGIDVATYSLFAIFIFYLFYRIITWNNLHF
jgi:hypothetical protein